MPVKIDVQTNISDYELTVEKCSEIINVLQNSYKNIRKDMYMLFLGKKSLIVALAIASFMFLLFGITENMIFLYFMPLSVLVSMIIALLGAEYLITQTRKMLAMQIDIYKQKRDALKRKEECAIQ